ncbi:hypothetical protein fugu_014377 [Takifugu bimaculatus]|uniref:Uncharacterized protein n=1 Tax=Takifugu bimaculatus TaxID=433685 RepID=A0A4Z2C121_9TELE|nr:hypothetical protein fugu_014377 [Takifugu bimaculatus]
MLARRPHARAIRPATVGVVCADFSQATLSPTRKHKQERMMRFEVSGTLVIKFPSVLEGFQSDKQLPSPPPPLLFLAPPVTLFTRRNRLHFPTSGRVRLGGFVPIVGSGRTRQTGSEAFQKRRVSVEVRDSHQQEKLCCLGDFQRAKAAPSGPLAARRRKLLQWTDARLLMENSLRTGGKSLGDKVCLLPFMFQRKEGKKG